MGGVREKVLCSVRFFGSPEGNCQRTHLPHILNMHEGGEEKGKTTASSMDSAVSFFYC